MASLNDYIANLLAGVANARMQADLESMRIARIYAADPLLQHLPVPRFRLPTVTLDLPVGIDRPVETALPTDRAAAHQRMADALDSILSANGASTSARAKAPALRALSAVVDELAGNPRPDGAAIGQGVDQAMQAVKNALASSRRTKAGVMDSRAEASAREQLTSALQSLVPPRTSDIQLIVATSQLKELGPPESLTRIRLTVTEEGVEWTQSNPDDPSTRRLMRE